MNDFDLDKFDINKNYAIEASAGTGKTFNIVEIVKKLIENNIDFKNVLIVTYTEKAAEELKHRIREKVSYANVEDATIGTIHSFCQNIIKEYCIASGKSSNLTLIDESDASDFAKQFIRTPKMVDEIIKLKKYINEKLDGKEKKIDIEDDLIKELVSIANDLYLNNEDQEEKTIVTLDDRITNSYYRQLNNEEIYDGENLFSIIVDYFYNSNSIHADKHREFAEALRHSKDFKRTDNKNYIKKDFLDENELEKIESLKKLRDNTKKRKSYINAFVVKYSVDFYKQWQQEKNKLNLQTYNDMIRNVREEVVNNGPLLNKLKEKYTYAIIDEFQDTNQKQWDIFKNVFLCDDNHHITVVGDPKQSIYAFQGSDINVYNEAIKEIENNNGIKCPLSCNYRASQGIVESTGNFFNNSNALAKSLNFEPSSCGKQNLKFKYDGSEDVQSYWIWNPSDNTNDDGEEELIDNENEIDKYARIVCQTIIDCCTKKEGKTKLRVVRESSTKKDEYYEDNVSFKDFAILARTRSEMVPIINALESSGIPYIQYKDASVFKGIECANWIAILDAIALPNFSGKNRGKFKKALYTNFFGYSFKEINSSEFNKDNINEIIMFDNWKILAKDNKWAELINNIIIDTELEKRLYSLEYIKSIGIFRQIGDYCINYLVKNRSLKSLVDNLKKMQKNIKDEEYDDNSNITAINTDFDCVKIMTIHASKGLEFPVVISVAGFKKEKPGITLYNYHSLSSDVKEHFISFVKPDDYGIGEYDKERREEWQRLFYVAYTRAKYVLMLPNYEKTGDDFIKDSIENYINNYSYKLLSDNEKTFVELSDNTKKILEVNSSSASTEEEVEQKKILENLIKSKTNHSSFKHAYSSLSHHKEKKVNITEENTMVSEAEDEGVESLSKYDELGKQINCLYDSSKTPIVLPNDFPAGAGLGNAIHEIFEVIDYTNASKSSDNDALINKCFAKQGFGKTCKWIDEVYEIVDNVLFAKLPVINGKEYANEEFKLNEISLVDRKNEMEFNFNKDNEKLKNYFNGFIDLVFKRGEYYSILDWKSDRLNDDFSSYSDGSIMKEHIDDLYSIQRVLYSYCLIKWLKNFYKDPSYEEIFEKHFGGVYYVCVRGCNKETGNGIYAHTWNSFKELEDAYNKIVKERIGA